MPTKNIYAGQNIAKNWKMKEIMLIRYCTRKDSLLKFCGTFFSLRIFSKLGNLQVPEPISLFNQILENIKYEDKTGKRDWGQDGIWKLMHSQMIVIFTWVNDLNDIWFK